MEEKRLWETFEKTGAVADYLSYKAQANQREVTEKAGEERFESENKSDRSGIGGHTDR